jgi:hypothetical protein
MRSLDGQTALVCGGGGVLGRAIALALAARGVRIVVTGPDERALGETVGEIVHGGGKARHLAGDVRDASHLEAAFVRATDVFGAVSIAVAAEEGGAGASMVETALGALARQLRGPGRLLVAGSNACGPLVSDAGARTVDRRAEGITCNAVIADGVFDDVADGVAALVVFLCSRAADGITAQAIAVGHAVGKPTRGA